MRNLNLSNFKLDSLPDGIVFFIQRLDELLFWYTIDSFKPLALNSYSLCWEAINTINEIESNKINENNIFSILEELKQALQEDFIAKKLILTEYTYYVNINDTEKLDLIDLKDRLLVLERCLRVKKYYKSICTELIDKIQKNHKKDIDFLCKNLITTLTNISISKRYIYHRFQEVFLEKGKPIDNLDQIFEFLTSLFPKKREFKVYFKVSDVIIKHQELFKYLDIQIIKPEDHRHRIEFEKIKSFHKMNTFIRIDNIKSSDPYIARDIAELRIETIINTVKLSSHQNNIRINRNALVEENTDDAFLLNINKNLNPMTIAKTQSYNDIKNNTSRIILSTNLQSESFKKFLSAIELHSNCLRSMNYGNQLVNLWTIFETIVPSNTKTSTINNIVSQVTPILLMRYFNRILRSLLSDLNQWDESYLKKLLGQIGEEDSDLLKFGLLLASDEFKPLRERLYNDLGSYSVMRNRLFSYSEILSDSKKIIKWLERHDRNISWQIRRIYRTRNLIVHTNYSPQYIFTLIENAHDYIDQIILYIVEVATTEYKIYDLKQGFLISQILEKKMMQDLKSSTTPKDYMKALLEIGE